MWSTVIVVSKKLTFNNLEEESIFFFRFHDLNNIAAYIFWKVDKENVIFKSQIHNLLENLILNKYHETKFIKYNIS